MSGRPDFDVGDLVVCVDDSPASMGLFHYRRGMVLRVARMWPPETTKRNRWVFDEVGRHPTERGHFASRFRKLDLKPPEFWTGEIEANQRDKVPA